MRVVAALFLLIAIATSALAVQPDEVLKDPSLEARARALSQQLRCMVCQNQSIDDSDAPLARDLRLLVRERLSTGDSDRQVMDFIVSRYGEFVLLKPVLQWHTALLWVLPPGLLLVGGAVLLVLSRRRQPLLANSTLTNAEQAKLAELVKAENDRVDLSH
jgi:cytochrome c-type biogenesis protein CcmH